MLLDRDYKKPDVIFAPPAAFDPYKLLPALKRQYVVLLSSLCVAVILGAVYHMTAVPKYTATAQLLIDSKRGLSSGLSGQAPLADLNLDTGTVDSQVEILKSRKIVNTVIDDLKLGAEHSGDGILRNLLRADWWAGTAPDKEEDKNKKDRDAVAQSLERNLWIRRLGRTYVLDVSYTATNPDKAADIANAFAKAYLNDVAEANYELHRRSSEWLLARIQELKKKSLESDFAVQRFKSEKGLVSTLEGGASILVNEQQLGQINTQLVSARAETANARAKYDRIRSIIDSGQMDDAVSEALSSLIIVELRNKYLAASKSEADLAIRVGHNHEQAVKLRAEMDEYKRLIFDELGRIAKSYKGDVDIATMRERSLEKSLAGQVGVSGSVNQDLVTLRELTRETDSYRNLYQNMLQLYQESVQKQSIPVSEARVIALAEPPSTKSWPKGFQTMAMSLLLGGVFGGGLAIFREVRDRGFRTAGQVRECLRLDYVGMLPAIAKEQLKAIPVSPRGGDGLASSPPLLQYAFKAPLSEFAETLRGARLAADIALGEKRPKVIGVISVLPHEGKSTISKNLASLISLAGMKTLLIDGDLRNPALTRDSAPRSREGFVEVLTGGRPLNDVLLSEAETQLAFLPGSIDRRVNRTSELLASSAMDRLLAEAKKNFNYIVIDLPPLAPVVDVRAAAKYFDAFVLAIEWGKTPRNVVISAMDHNKDIYRKCVGVILNNVDKNKLSLYEYNRWEEHYNRAYYRNEAADASTAVFLSPSAERSLHQ